MEFSKLSDQAEAGPQLQVMLTNAWHVEIRECRCPDNEHATVAGDATRPSESTVASCRLTAGRTHEVKRRASSSPAQEGLTIWLIALRPSHHLTSHAFHSSILSSTCLTASHGLRKLHRVRTAFVPARATNCHAGAVLPLQHQ